jgi:hypothetical protein
VLDLPLSFFNTSTYLCTVYSILTDSLSYMTSRAYVQHGRNRAMKLGGRAPGALLVQSYESVTVSVLRYPDRSFPS